MELFLQAVSLFLCTVCMTAHVPAHGFMLFQLLTIGCSYGEWTRRFVVFKHGCKQCWMLQKIYDEENVFSIFVKIIKMHILHYGEKKTVNINLSIYKKTPQGTFLKNYKLGYTEWSKVHSGQRCPADFLVNKQKLCSVLFSKTPRGLTNMLNSFPSSLKFSKQILLFFPAMFTSMFTW